MQYFHGGAPNLKMILPPDDTGAPSCASYGAEHVCKTNKVYLSSMLEGAMIFAAMHPSDKGTLYEVEPMGILEEDPDFHGPTGISFQCDKARVIRKIKIPRKVLFKLRKELMKDFI